MGLAVDPPESPPLTVSPDPGEYDDVEVVAPANYRREEIAELLADGAWEVAFRSWAERAHMTEDEFSIVEDLGMIERFDFFWDDFADRVGYHAPGLPEDWREREIHPELESWGMVSSINAGLTELGQEVCDVLEADYIEWEAEFEPPDDLPDFS